MFKDYNDVILDKEQCSSIISDEIYELINFKGKHESIAQFASIRNRVIIINEGKLVADDPIGELQNRIKGEHLITVKFLNTSFQLSELKSINGVDRVEAKEGEVKIYADAGTDVRPDIFRLCAAKGWVIIEMVQEKLSVEYIFQKLTKNKHD